MEHDRIAQLLSSTPPGTPEPRPDPDRLVRRFRRRRVRRVAAATAAGGLAVIGLVVPLALLGGVGTRGQGPGPAATGPTAPATTGPAVTPPGGSEPTGGTLPDVGVIRCTASGAEVATPSFAVQPDGPHFLVDDRVGADYLAIQDVATGDKAITLPLEGDEMVLPWFQPGTYTVGCGAFGTNERGEGGPAFSVVDRNGIWTAPRVECETYNAPVIASPVESTDDLADVIRDRVNGIAADDELVRAGYPESTENVSYLVRRDGQDVALVQVLARVLPANDPVLWVQACVGSGVGEGQEGPRPT
jgi:hypothetical protein